MLAGQPRHGLAVVTLPGVAVTVGALIRIQLLAQLFARTVADVERAVAREACRVGGDVRDVLRVREQAAAGVMLHANVPSRLMAIVDELSSQNAEMLATDARDAAILRAMAHRAVAHGTIPENRGAVLQIRAGTLHRGKLLAGRLGAGSEHWQGRHHHEHRRHELHGGSIAIRPSGRMRGLRGILRITT